MDSQNFNAYILRKLRCSPAECERRIKGKNVPIMVIHALVQLRESYNTVSNSPAIDNFEKYVKGPSNKHRSASQNNIFFQDDKNRLERNVNRAGNNA